MCRASGTFCNIQPRIQHSGVSIQHSGTRALSCHSAADQREAGESVAEVCTTRAGGAGHHARFSAWLRPAKNAPRCEELVLLSADCRALSAKKKTGAFSPENVRRFLWSSAFAEGWLVALASGSTPEQSCCNPRILPLGLRAEHALLAGAGSIAKADDY